MRKLDRVKALYGCLCMASERHWVKEHNWGRVGGILHQEHNVQKKKNYAVFRFFYV